MKLLKIIIAIPFALFALAHCVLLPLNAIRGDHISGLMGNVFGICVGAIISILLFRSALSQPNPNPNPPPADEE